MRVNGTLLDYQSVRFEMVTNKENKKGSRHDGNPSFNRTSRYVTKCSRLE